MYTVSRALRVASIMALAVFASACNSDSSTGIDTSLQVASVSVAPSNLTLRVNETSTLTAIVNGGANVSQQVTWRSVDPSRATVSAAGVVTAKATGNTALIARSITDTTKFAQVEVTVLPAPGVRSIAITNGTGTISVGNTMQFTAQVDAETGVSRAVTWRSASPAIATIDASGKATAVAAGQSVIVAMPTADTTQKAYGLLTVVPAVSGINSIAVAPNAGALTVGQSLQIVATVSANAGISRTVSWTSSNNAVATVSTSGLVTAVSNGPAIITARSTVDTSMAASAAITVRAQQQATVQISSITTGNTNTPINPANVAGQIDVTLNIDAGDQTISRVALFLDNTEVAAQTFSALQLKAMKLASVSASASSAPIIFSVNTAAFDSATGTPKYLNGDRQLRASLTLLAGQAGSQAQVVQSLTFANASGFLVRARATGSTATDAAGYRWDNGNVIVKILPVFYASGSAFQSASVSFGGVTRIIAAGQDSTVFYADSITGIKNYQTASALAPDAVTITSVLANGNMGPSTIFNPTTATFRIDNLAPAAPGFALVTPPGTLLAPNGAWINRAYSFTTGFTAGADLGVGNATTPATTYQYDLLPNATAADTAWVNVVYTNGVSNLPATADSAGLAIRVKQADRLGNTRVTALAAIPGLGVDLQAPTVAFCGASAVAGCVADANAVDNNTALTAAGTRTFKLASQDNGPSGNFPGTPISALFTRMIPGITTQVGCLSTFNAVSGACEVAAYTPDTPVDNGTGLEGYFAFGGYVADRAGNATTFAAKTVAVDFTAPTASAVALTVNASGVASVAAMAEDNLDLISADARTLYSAAGGITILNGQQTLGVGFDGTPNGYGLNAVGTAQLPVAMTFARFYRQLQDVDGVNAPLASPADPRPTTQRIRVFDVAGNASNANQANPITTAIATPFTSGSQAINVFNITGTTATSLAASVTRNGLVDIQALVQRVDFYYLSGGLYRYLGSTGSGLRAQLGGNSVWTFSGTPVTAGLAAGNYTVRGIAVDALGNGLVSQSLVITIP